MGAWFKEFRNEHGFTSYHDNETAVTVDVPLVAVTYFCVLLSVATLIATLGIRGRERWSAAVRACYAVAVGSILLVCLVGHGWQDGEVGITAPYVYRSNHLFKGNVGIRVGLHGTNVTLEGYYKGAHGIGHVRYSEEMPWADFGHEMESYNLFLHRGLPEPVLKVLEFLCIDEGGLRWGRSFHTAGHYANVLLWTAFAFWLVTNLLLVSVVVYGAYMFFLTGVTMVLACISYHAFQLDQPLVIAFGDADLRISYGWSFWLTLCTGCLTLILGLALIIFDHFAHDDVAMFFHLEKLDQYENAELCEDQKPPGNSLSYVIDRRGSIVPPLTHDQRRGSIFIGPGRRPTRYNDSLIRSLGLTPAPSQVFSLAGFGVGGGSSPFLNKLVEGEASNSILGSPKASTHSAETSGKNKSTPTDTANVEDEIRSDMECVCKDSEVCASSRKPSLATLREHRENHANEKKWASTTNPAPPRDKLVSMDQRDIALTDRSRRTSNNSESSSECGIVISPTSFGFANSAPNSTPTSPTKAEASGRSSPLFHHHKRALEQMQAKTKVDEEEVRGTDSEVIVHAESFSRQSSDDSADSRAVSSASSVDSGRGVTGSNSSGVECSYLDDELSKIKSDRKRNFATTRDVIVDMESTCL